MLTVLNPATEETIAGETERAGVDETDAAVARAKEAFPAWRAVAQPIARLLRRLATLVEERGEARGSSRATWASRSRARGARSGWSRRSSTSAPGAVDKHHGEVDPVAGSVDVTFREPLGVVGLIVPWNFPLNIASWKLGPALACGNTVVLKPAELTPLSALRLGSSCSGRDPRGSRERRRRQGGRWSGTRLVEHPDVAKIGFTGSTEVERR